MARALGLILIAAAAVGALWLLLPHPAQADETALWTLAAATAGSRRRHRLGAARRRLRRGPHVVAAACTLAISAAVYFTHLPGSGTAFLYLWAAPFVSTSSRNGPPPPTPP